jgi:ATP-binding cassette subfamily A (ABC1) protein 3
VASGINFYESLPSQFKYVLCFLPNVSLNLCLQVIFQYERSERSLSMDNLGQNLFDDPLNVAAVLVAATCWSLFFYLPLIWYFEKVMPGKFGIALPFYFPFMVTSPLFF